MKYLAGPARSGVFVGPSICPPDVMLLDRVTRGDTPTTVYVLDPGAIKLVHVDSEGEEHALDIRQVPALVGAAFAVAGRASIVEAVTISRCTFRSCSAQAFIAASRGDERVSKLHRLQCTEIVELFGRAATMSSKSSARLSS